MWFSVKYLGITSHMQFTPQQLCIGKDIFEYQNAKFSYTLFNSVTLLLSKTLKFINLFIQENVHYLGIELLPLPPFQLPKDIHEGHHGAMGSRTGHGIEGIGDRNDSRLKVQVRFERTEEPHCQCCRLQRMEV